MTGNARHLNLAGNMTWGPLMNKQRHVLLVGARAFAKSAAALLESCEDIDTLHTTHVTIDLFLAKWRPDCAIVNCDDLEHDPLTEVEALSRFQPKVAIMLVSSSCVSQWAALAVAAILLPSEIDRRLAPLVTSLLKEGSHLSI